MGYLNAVLGELGLEILGKPHEVGDASESTLWTFRSQANHRYAVGTWPKVDVVGAIQDRCRSFRILAAHSMMELSLSRAGGE